MPIPTVTELNEGKEDLDDLESLVNGTGNVQTRLGGIKPSYSQLTSALTHGDIDAYDPTETVTLATQWRSHSGIVYRPIPSALPISPTSPLETSPNTAKWLAVQLTFDKAQERYPNRQAFIDSTPDPLTAMVWIDSFYPYGSAASPYTEPKGGHLMWRTGATNTAPTVSSSPLPSVSYNGTGTQAGYSWDAGGAEWSIYFDGEVSVKWFGAIGDGVTDDTDAIQDAFDFIASNGGGAIYLPAGNYLVSSTLTWPNIYYIKMYGDGSSASGNGASQVSASRITYSGSATCLQIHGTAWDANQVGGELRDLYIVGPGSGGSTIGVSLLWASGSTGRIAYNNVFVDRFNIGYRMEAVLDGTFINCNARGCSTGWYLEGATEAVNANDFISCAADSSSVGVYMQNGVNGNRWLGGVIQGNDIGVHVHSDTFGPYSNIWYGTWFESANANARAFKFDTGGTPGTLPRGNIIKECLISSHRVGIELLYSLGTTIEKCRFIDMPTSGSNQPASVGASAQNTKIINNLNLDGGGSFQNDYSFASAGPGTIIIDWDGSNNERQRVVGSSGVKVVESDGGATQLKNLSGTVFLNTDMSSGNERLELVNAAKLIGYSDNFSTQNFRLVDGYLGLRDGITAPSTISGMALMYIDSADGDLKIKFGDGTTKTIVTDT